MYDFIYYQVRDVMTTKTFTVSRETHIKQVEEIFENHDFNGLPVVDEDGRLLGMVTKLDVLKAFSFTKDSLIPHYDYLIEQEAGKIMTEAPDYVEPETPLTRVLKKMVDTRHKSFPVLEEGRLKGIVAREDVLMALRRAAYGELPERLEGEELTEPT